MLSSLPTLLSRMDSVDLRRCDVIPWGCPVPVFGNLARSKVATLGINPSNLEFVDEYGIELDGERRRFHTLHSLELSNWRGVDATHLRAILESFDQYFERNPYDRWFKRLDIVLSGAGVTFYESTQPSLPLFERLQLACHLDLVPYATSVKWTDLNVRQRESLLRFGGNCLGQLLRDSQVDFVVCNGKSVVQQLEFVGEMNLQREEIEGCELPRRSTSGVKGFGYTGKLSQLCGVDIGREVTVLGFNHNLQSSFGVTNTVVKNLTDWIANQIRGRES
jgi:hypothetical protein